MNGIFVVWNNGLGIKSIFDFSNTAKSPGELQISILVVLAFVVVGFVTFTAGQENWDIKHVVSKNLRIGSMVVVTIVLAIGNAAIQGVYDAQQGVRLSGGWIIQKVFVSNADSIDKNLDGPFGLVAENENSYFLIRWKTDNQEYFQRNPGIYILPRNGLTIIPANDPSLAIVSPAATPTVILLPTQIMTATLEPTNTIVPILTPTITITPSQP